MDSLSKQIYNNLTLKETRELLEIWELHDTDEWQEDTFEIVAQILTERLGHPPQYASIIPASPACDEDPEQQRLLNQSDARLLLQRAYKLLGTRSFAQALEACRQALQLAPGLAEAYTCRGQIYEELGCTSDALGDYAAALRLDLEDEEAYVNLAALEDELNEAFEASAARRHLEFAAEFALDDEPEKALEEIDFARRDLPGIAPAYTYLGSILAELRLWEQAEDAFLQAIHLNPRCSAARQKLAAVKVQLEAEQYRQAVLLNANQLQAEEELASSASYEEAYDLAAGQETVEEEGGPAEGEPVPGWVYLGEKEFTLSGWPGHRTRPGRSGYDPLETDFEQAHITGILIRRLFTLKLRSHNPVYLLLMVFFGLIGISHLFLL